MTTDRLPPHDSALEQAVLSCLIQSPREAASEFITSVRGSHDLFYSQQHRALCDVIVSLVDAGKPVDLVTLDHEIRARGLMDGVGGLEYILATVDAAPSAANLSYYMGKLKALHVRRSLMAAGTKIIQTGQDGLEETMLEDAERIMLGVRMDSASTAERSMRELVTQSIDDFEAAIANRGTLRGLGSGFHDLDRLTHGLRPGQLVVLAARPGLGKTSLALNIAEHVAVDQGTDVGVFSLEMGDTELTTRAIASRARVSGDKLQEGTLSEQELMRVSAAARKISAAPLHICDEGGLTIGQLRARARRWLIQSDIKLLIVDYLQLMRGRRSENRTAEITEISNGLKALAKELRLPIIALSQLNRDLERDKEREPRLSDLRDSGSVEQDADIVLFLHTTAKPDANGRELEPLPVDLIVRKHRNGQLAKIPLMFSKPSFRFDSAVTNRRVISPDLN